MKSYFFSFLVGFFCFASTTAAEPEVEFDSALFEDVEELEEVDPKIVIPQEKPQFSIKDIPFYATIFWSYVYEEKLYPTYAAVAAWFQHLFKKRHHS